jgi:hypothetical protein
LTPTFGDYQLFKEGWMDVSFQEIFKRSTGSHVSSFQLCNYKNISTMHVNLNITQRLGTSSVKQRYVN